MMDLGLVYQQNDQAVAAHDLWLAKGWVVIERLWLE